MFTITKKDKKEILKILLDHNCRCKMSDLVKEYSYLNDKKTKRAKIKEIIKVLNKELSKMIEVQIVEVNGWVEVDFE